MSNTIKALLERQQERKQQRIVRRIKNIAHVAIATGCIANLIIMELPVSAEPETAEEAVVSVVSYAAPAEESVVTVAIPATVEEPVVEVEEEPAYTAEELEALALAIYQEAGGDMCSDETRMMVGNVVMNRVADSRYPDTIEEVLLQKQQYGRLYWTGLVWPERHTNPGEAHAVARAYECAERILNGERVLPDDVIYQAEFVQGREIVAQQDGFYFCR